MSLKKFLWHNKLRIKLRKFFRLKFPWSRKSNRTSRWNLSRRCRPWNLRSRRRCSRRSKRYGRASLKHSQKTRKSSSSTSLRSNSFAWSSRSLSKPDSWHSLHYKGRLNWYDKSIRNLKKLSRRISRGRELDPSCRWSQASLTKSRSSQQRTWSCDNSNKIARSSRSNLVV